MACFICGESKLFKFLDLGKQPPSDAFLREGDLKQPERTYPLELYWCGTCGLVQLGFIVDPKELFTEYVYTTGMNNSLRANFKALVGTLVQRFGLGKGTFAVDIGSNDGTLLQNYQPFGVPGLGIDPGSAGELAVKRGIPTVRDFWNKETAERVVEEHGRAKVITGTNVFAHVPDLDSFMTGILHALTEDGVFVSESGYLLDMLQTLGYDAIYHEHLRYYALQPLMRLFQKSGMEIFDVERIPSHNGSIRVYAARSDAYQIMPSVGELLSLEEREGLGKKETYTAFASRVHRHKDALRKLVYAVEKSGERIVGIGAPAKGNTLLNFCGFGTREIKYLAEKSDLKIGLCAPGSRIPVVAEERLFQDKPEYALLLSWNLADELIPKLRSKGFRGKFIIPFPKIVIV